MTDANEDKKENRKENIGADKQDNKQERMDLLDSIVERLNEDDKIKQDLKKEITILKKRVYILELKKDVDEADFGDYVKKNIRY